MPDSPSRRDPRVRDYVLPTRVVWQTEGEAAPDNSVCLLHNDSEQALFHFAPPERFCRLRPGAGLLLDFGRERHGSVQIVTRWTPHNSPAKVRVRFGESVTEAMSEPMNDHALHDGECLLPWCGSHEVGMTGFRFVRLDALHPEGEVELAAVRAVSIVRDLPYVGAFSCSDERLNAIWRTGAYTVHLNMQDYVWDGIKRDRAVWIGDMHPETRVIHAVFGASDVVRASLDFARDNTPLPHWMNGISSYSFWWVLIQQDVYLHSGDRTYLDQQRSYLLGLLRLMARQVDEAGRERLGGHRFLDWPSSEDPAAIGAGLHALLRMALVAGAELCDVLGEDGVRRECREVADRMTHTAPPLDPGSKQAAALMALAGLHPAEDANKAVLSRDPFSGLSTFYGYYVLQGRALAGDYGGCLDVLRRYWGAMLDLGATTFWEDFDLSWAENAGRIDEIVPPGLKDVHADYGNYCYKGLRHSLCHGWAGGPTAWLSEHVLGVQPVAPGCRTIRIAPHLGDLEWAEGAYPTPYGPVRVRHEKDADGHVHSQINAPEGVTIIRPQQGENV